MDYCLPFRSFGCILFISSCLLLYWFLLYQLRLIASEFFQFCSCFVGFELDILATVDLFFWGVGLSLLSVASYSLVVTVGVLL